MDMVAAGLVLVGLIWTGGFAWAHFRAVGKAKAAESWPSAAGTIHGCTIVEEESTDRDGHSSTWYRPVVDYGYSAGGRDHRGERLRFGNYRSASRDKAEKMLARYRAGGAVPVRYNPDDPTECVLETARPGPLYLVMAAFGLLFVGFGLFWGSLA